MKNVKKLEDLKSDLHYQIWYWIIIFCFLILGLIFIGDSFEKFLNTDFTTKEFVVVTKQVVEECACMPCIDEPQFEECEFESAYISVKDSLEFKKGEIFTLKNMMWIDNLTFCNETETCYSPETIVTSGFFKHY